MSNRSDRSDSREEETPHGLPFQYAIDADLDDLLTSNALFTPTLPAPPPRDIDSPEPESPPPIPDHVRRITPSQRAAVVQEIVTEKKTLRG
ncbi:hypothetical protein K402DRAFT_464029 [Aulographum hederae CBS 113979]|uniref:Uncharacterized protein n=1 Tax=Aulographum hederae CBS 113979 TaxID=1176131 RepID=A0A6G1GYK5_9PEZI|nr:hypothetical protein K402DRAFT_464029 [Aulographum hederae CBS 113979]